MYLYTEVARRQLANVLHAASRGRRKFDPRATDYLAGPYLKKFVHLFPEHLSTLVLGHETSYDAARRMQILTWESAPESARQALMNGEEMRALNPFALADEALRALRKLNWYLRQGKGQGCSSILGHTWEAIDSAFQHYYNKAWLRREKRLLRRGLTVVHTETYVGYEVDVVLIHGHAALAQVGKALQNCMRNAYTGTDRNQYVGQIKDRFRSRVYVAFWHHDLVTGKRRWTSLADAYIPTGDWLKLDCQKVTLTHNDHQAVSNLEDKMPPEDAAMWHKFCWDPIYTKKLRDAWQRVSAYKADRQTKLQSVLNATTSPPRSYYEQFVRGHRFGKSTLVSDWMDEWADHILRGSVSGEQRTVTGRIISTGPNWQEVRRRYISPDRLIRASDLQVAPGVQMSVEGLIFDEAHHFINVDSYCDFGASKAVNIKEDEDQERVREHNIASPRDRRLKQDLEHRQAQRRTTQRRVNPLLARMAGRISSTQHTT